MYVLGIDLVQSALQKPLDASLSTILDVTFATAPIELSPRHLEFRAQACGVT